MQAEAAAAREAEASQRAEQAAQDAAEVRELAQREAAAHESALQEASQKAARLARLEGARPTGCSSMVVVGAPCQATCPYNRRSCQADIERLELLRGCPHQVIADDVKGRSLVVLGMLGRQEGAPMLLAHAAARLFQQSDWVLCPAQLWSLTGEAVGQYLMVASCMQGRWKPCRTPSARAALTRLRCWGA